MPVKTITAEIDGKTRKITADIPDGASQDDIMDAVSSFVSGSSNHGATGSWDKKPSWWQPGSKADPNQHIPTEKEIQETGGGPKGNAMDVLPGLGVVEGAEGLAKAISSGTVKGFLAKLGTGAVAGYATKKGAKALGASEGLSDIAGAVGGGAGMYAEGRVGNFLRSIPEDVAKGSWLNFAKWLAERSKTDDVAAEILPKVRDAASGPTANRPGTDTSRRSSYAPPAPKSPEPVNAKSLPEGINPPVPPSVRNAQPSTPAPASTDLSRQPSLSPKRQPTADELEFDKAPRKSSPKGTLPSPKTPLPGSVSTVDAPKVKEAVEMVKSLGATPESLKSAPQSQWDVIGKQLGVPVDENFKRAVIEEAGNKSPAKPSPNGSLPAPKTPRPSPGGEKVESTVTPEARAARADDHATKLAQKIRKTLPSDKIPEPGNDAAWKVLEDQTGTEATPAVRKSAIDKARKLWSEGPRSAGDLQKRRSEFFANKSKE